MDTFTDRQAQIIGKEIGDRIAVEVKRFFEGFNTYHIRYSSRVDLAEVFGKAIGEAISKPKGGRYKNGN